MLGAMELARLPDGLSECAGKVEPTYCKKKKIMNFRQFGIGDFANECCN
jgi:hypothetical protein